MSSFLCDSHGACCRCVIEAVWLARVHAGAVGTGGVSRQARWLPGSPAYPLCMGRFLANFELLGLQAAEGLQPAMPQFRSLVIHLLSR